MINLKDKKIVILNISCIVLFTKKKEMDLNINYDMKGKFWMYAKRKIPKQIILCESRITILQHMLNASDYISEE